MERQPKDAIQRVCRCLECRDADKDAASGTLDYLKAYGPACGNCGFYAPLSADEAEGHCHRFGIRKQGASMSLVRRRRGELTEGAFPFLVGGCFYCSDFRPVHDEPNPDDPVSLFWALRQP